MQEVDFQRIFNPIYTILGVNNQLYSTLQLIETNQTTETIGKLFKKMSAFFKMYQDYINNYDETISFINDLLKKNSKFYEFFMDAQKRLNVIDAVANFYAYMITPVQRIPRYILLLRELQKYTANDDPDYANVEASVNALETVAKAVNQRVKEFDAQRKLITLAAQLTGLEPLGEDLIQAHRKPIAEFEICRINGQKKRTMYLFNDLIVICSKKQYHDHVKFLETPIVWADADIKTAPEAFFIVSDKQTLFFKANTKAEADKIVMQINDCMTQLVSATPRLQNQPKANFQPYVPKKKKTILSKDEDAKPANEVPMEDFVSIAEMMDRFEDSNCFYDAGDIVFIHKVLDKDSAIIFLADPDMRTTRNKNNQDQIFLTNVPCVKYRELTNQERKTNKILLALASGVMDKEMIQPAAANNKGHRNSVLRRASMFLSRSQNKVQVPNATQPLFVNQHARMKAIALISASNYATNKTAEVVQGVKTINMYAHTEHQVIQQLQENATPSTAGKQDWQKMIVKKKKPKQQPASKGGKPSNEPDSLAVE